MPVRSIAVIGAGTMGRGIAHVSAQGGFETILQDIADEILTTARSAIEQNLKKGVERGKVTLQLERETLGRLKVSTSLEESVKHADLVIEAIPEDLTLKCELFEKLHKVAPASCLFASNTSSMSIGEMSIASGRSGQMFGMHFFNPVHVMKLVELVRAETTDDKTMETALDVVAQMKKESVEVKESPGFVTSRMNVMIGNEAFKMLEEGIASAEDIDKAMKLGLNHPMGPFELGDLVGLDVRLSILKYLHRKLGERFKPSLLLEKYVKEGRLGRKVGRGVYPYPD